MKTKISILLCALLFLLTLNSFSQANVIYNDIKIDLTRRDDFVIVRAENKLLGFEENVAMLKSRKNTIDTYKVVDMKLRRVVGYLPAGTRSTANLVLKENYLNECGQYIVYCGDDGYLIYNRSGKFVTTLPYFSLNSTTELILNKECNRVIYVKDNDLFVADYDPLKKAVTNNRQVSFSGNYGTYMDYIKFWEGNGVMASQTQLWINLQTGVQKKVPFKFKQYVGGVRIPDTEVVFDSKNGCIYFTSSEDAGGWSNASKNFTVSKFEINTGVITKVFEYKGELKEVSTALIGGDITNYPKAFFLSIIDDNLYISFLSKTYKYSHTSNTLIEYNNKNNFATSGQLDNSQFNGSKTFVLNNSKVVNMSTNRGELFTPDFLNASNARFVNDSLVIYALSKDNNQDIDLENVGTYTYNVYTKENTKIFNYVLSEYNDMLVTRTSKSTNSLLIVANGFIWEYTINGNKKTKLTDVQSNLMGSYTVMPAFYNVGNKQISSTEKSSKTSGEVEKKEERVEKSIPPTSSPSNYKSLLEEGAKKFQERAYNEALSKFEQALSLMNNKDTISSMYAGYSALQMNNPGKASTYFTTYLNSGGRDVTNFILLAKVYRQQSEFDNALEVLRQGLSMYPYNTELETQIINTFLDANRSDDAISLLNERVLKNPNAENYFQIGILFDNKGNKTEAFKNYEKAINLNPNHYDALYNIGVFYYNEGAAATPNSRRRNFEKALTYFERAYKLKKDDCGLVKNLNKTYELLDSARRVECH